MAGVLVVSPAAESHPSKEMVVTQRASEAKLEHARLDVLAAPLSVEEVDKDRENAIANLFASLPKDKQLDYLRNSQQLRAESQIYVPDLAERTRLAANYAGELQSLLNRIAPGTHGLFALAEIGTERRETHRLYVLHKSASGEARFIKAYRISMGEKGFGNERDSGKTPLGLTSIKSILHGLYGEVIPAKPDSLKYFKTVVKGADGRMHSFASDFGHQNILEPATITTDRYTIDEQRGVHFHGSNRTGRWRERSGSRVWETFLDAKRRSGACGRMANADVRDLGRYIQSPDPKKGTAGTPVYIHASEEIRRQKK